MNPHTHRAYVSNYSFHTVSVIDTTTNTVTATIGRASRRPCKDNRFHSTRSPYGIAVNPSAPRLYVSFDRDGQICEIDTTSNGLVNGIRFAAGGKSDIVLNPATDKIYVVLDVPGSSSFSKDWVGVVDANTHAQNWIDLGVGANPSGLALIP